MVNSSRNTTKRKANCRCRREISIKKTLWFLRWSRVDAARRVRSPHCWKTCNFFLTAVTTNQKKLDESEGGDRFDGSGIAVPTSNNWKNPTPDSCAARIKELQIAYEKEVKRAEDLVYDRDLPWTLRIYSFKGWRDAPAVRKKGNGGDAEGQNAKHVPKPFEDSPSDLLPNQIISEARTRRSNDEDHRPNGKTLYSDEGGPGEFVNKEKPEDKPSASKAVNH